MTSNDITPVAPPTLGEALAFPGIYLEPPAGLLAAVPAPRVRRPGRMRRRMAALAAVAAAAGLALAGCGAFHHAPAGCLAPAAADGTTISVDQAGNASSPADGGLEFACGRGRWVRIASPAAVVAQPQRPVWDGRHPAVWTSVTPPICEARIAGRHSWIRPGGSGPAFLAECQPDGAEFAWGVAE